jgi:hypothetical protein
MIPPARGKLTWANLSGALVLALRIVLHVGILSDYRKPFWRAARHALRRGQIDAVLGMGFIAPSHPIHPRGCAAGERITIRPSRAIPRVRRWRGCASRPDCRL